MPRRPKRVPEEIRTPPHATELEASRLMQEIFVRQFGREDAPFVLTVGSAATIEVVKRLIFQHVGLEPRSQMITFGDLQLSADSKTLQEYEVFDGSTLILHRLQQSLPNRTRRAVKGTESTCPSGIIGNISTGEIDFMPESEETDPVHEKNCMQIFVSQFGHEEKPLILNVGNAATIEIVKRLIHQLVGLKPHEQMLAFRETALFVDSTPLVEYNVTNGSTLTLVRKALSLIVTASSDSTSKIWDATIGECLQTLTGHSGTVWAAALSHDGTMVGTASQDCTAKIWMTSNGACTHTLMGHTGEVYSLAFSSDGVLLATGSHDKTVKIWGIASEACIHTFTEHTGEVNSTVFSLNDALVLTASQDGTAKIWSTQHGGCIQTLAEHGGKVNSAVFFIDASSVLTASDDRSARMWNASTGECLRTFKGHTFAVWSVSSSSDYALIVTGSVDLTAKIWEATTGECIFTLLGHTGTVNSAVFAPDDSSVFTASDDGTVKMWESGKCTRTLAGHCGAVLSASFR